MEEAREFAVVSEQNSSKSDEDLISESEIEYGSDNKRRNWSAAVTRLRYEMVLSASLFCILCTTNSLITFPLIDLDKDFVSTGFPKAILLLLSIWFIISFYVKSSLEKADINSFEVTVAEKLERMEIVLGSDPTEEAEFFRNSALKAKDQMLEKANYLFRKIPKNSELIVQDVAKNLFSNIRNKLAQSSGFVSNPKYIFYDMMERFAHLEISPFGEGDAHEYSKYADLHGGEELADFHSRLSSFFYTQYNWLSEIDRNASRITGQEFEAIGGDLLKFRSEVKFVRDYIDDIKSLAKFDRSILSYAGPLCVSIALVLLGSIWWLVNLIHEINPHGVL